MTEYQLDSTPCPLLRQGSWVHNLLQQATEASSVRQKYLHEFCLYGGTVTEMMSDCSRLVMSQRNKEGDYLHHEQLLQQLKREEAVCLDGTKRG